MADNLDLIKISNLIPTTELKSADIIPISQDGQTRSIKGAVLEQNLLNKTDARYIENSQKGAPNGVATLDSQGEVIQPVKGVVKISDIGTKVPSLIDGKVPNTQLRFGKVSDGDPNVVSGGEVFNYASSKEVTEVMIALKDSSISYIEDIANGVNYGNSANIGGFGFCIKNHDNLRGLRIRINKIASSNVTKYRVILKKNNKDGEIILDELKDKVITNGINDLLFNNPINTNNTWCELYFDDRVFFNRVYPAIFFTQDKGYPYPMYTASKDLGQTPMSMGGQYYDTEYTAIVGIEEVDFTDFAQKRIKEISGSNNVNTNILTNENEKDSFVGSSVTWGDGYLQSRYVANIIHKKQSEYATSILASSFENGVKLNNRQFYKSDAIKLTGIGSELEFELNGNEVSIVQGIERSNLNASQIDIYIDGELYDTFNNFNPTEIGSETKSFTAIGDSNYFDLGRAFTYNHKVRVNGTDKIVVMNMIQGVGFKIPDNADCAIIRKIGIRSDGTNNVNHFLWLKNTPSNGDAIEVIFDYGENLFYEKTTIGQDLSGENECPYGDGTVSFDTTNPSSMGSGLDFRQTDERVVKTYRFLENKTRKVKLKIKGNYGTSTGTPYFIFNFATNRYFHFQNAGIGGWDAWDFDKTISQDPTRGWQRVVEFNPDTLIYEGTPNDDWIVKGHKIYKEQTLTLDQLRNVRTLPLRAITYQSASNNYKISKWQGIITAITETSVTFDATISEPIVKGDIVIIGEYFSRNDEYFERFVDSIEGNTVYFSNPLNIKDVVFSSLNDFVGKGIVIRDYVRFTDKMNIIIENIQNSLPSVKIGLLENPMPNCLARELWGYPLIFDKLAKNNKYTDSINYLSLVEWQNSQSKTKIVLNTSNKILDESIGKYYIPFGINGQNTLSTDIIHNGVSIYGTKAVVQNGWAYTVNQTASGAELNKIVGNPTNHGQVYNRKQARVILFDNNISGSITVEYSTILWSADSCHMNENSSELYGQFLANFMDV